MVKEISDAATIARLQLRKKARQLRASKALELVGINANRKIMTEKLQQSMNEESKDLLETRSVPTNESETSRKFKAGTTQNTRE